MLVLTRRPNQSIVIGDDIEIFVVEVRGDQVRIGINAPRETVVDRTEVAHRKQVYPKQVIPKQTYPKNGGMREEYGDPAASPSDLEILDRGTLVMTTHTIPSEALAGWVAKVAQHSEQPVAYRYVGGRACIIAMGNLARVRGAILVHLNEHHELQRARSREILGDDAFEPSYRLYGPGEFNTAFTSVQQMNQGHLHQGHLHQGQSNPEQVG